MSKQQWAWMHVGDERCSPPCDSREEAIADAYESDGPGRYTIGTCHFASVDDFASAFDADEMLERANDYAIENDFAWYEDCLFEYNRTPAPVGQATHALREALRAWARDWLTIPSVFTLEDTEDIEIGADGKVAGK